MVNFRRNSKEFNGSTTRVFSKRLFAAISMFFFVLSRVCFAEGAELPRETFASVTPNSGGRTIKVAAGESLRDAISAAQPGDEIVLQPGATFVGPFILPNKPGANWITIRSDGPVPAAGVRATAADASNMAKIVAPGNNQPALLTAGGAHNFYIEGIEITAVASLTQTTNLVNLGDGSSAQSTVLSQPHDIVLSHMYIHGTDALDVRRGVALNSARTAIINSTISNIHSLSDAQAIGGWNGTGNYLVENNALEASGENVMFGGADPKIPEALPRDITIRGNDFYKPLSWKGIWTVKNLLELKLGQRVLIEENNFSNNWLGADQGGFAINLKSTNQNGTAPWSQTSDVTFRRNIVENSPAGVTIGASENSALPAARFNNLFRNIGQFGGTSNGNLFQLIGYGGSLDSVTISNNTALQNLRAGSTISFDGERTTNFVFTNNIVTRGAYGIKGSGRAEGFGTLSFYAPNAVFTGNQLIGASAANYGRYASQNSFPVQIAIPLPRWEGDKCVGVPDPPAVKVGAKHLRCPTKR